MCSIAKVSHYFSYTDFIPFVSIPSGIVHLICHLRDVIIGKSRLPVKQPESLVHLAERHLDNWTHYKKGILALIPFIGNLILLFNWIDRRKERNKVLEFAKTYADPSIIPTKLYRNHDADSGEFFFKMLENAPPERRANIFKNGLVRWKESYDFLIKLIDKKVFVIELYDELSPGLKEMTHLLAEIFKQIPNSYSLFQRLTEKQRNSDPIALAAFNNAPDGQKGLVIEGITDTKILINYTEMHSIALRQGKIRLTDIPQESWAPEKVTSAVICDYRIWKDLPADLQTKTVAEDALGRIIDSAPLMTREMNLRHLLNSDLVKWYFPTGVPGTVGELKANIDRSLLERARSIAFSSLQIHYGSSDAPTTRGSSSAFELTIPIRGQPRTISLFN